jgi:hypothetical protein
MRYRNIHHRKHLMTEWLGWAIIKGDELCYVKQDHQFPGVSEFSARQEFQIYASRGEDVRLARVRITEQDQPGADQ